MKWPQLLKASVDEAEHVALSQLHRISASGKIGLKRKMPRFYDIEVEREEGDAYALLECFDPKVMELWGPILL